MCSEAGSVIIQTFSIFTDLAIQVLVLTTLVLVLWFIRVLDHIDHGKDLKCWKEKIRKKQSRMIIMSGMSVLVCCYGYALVIPLACWAPENGPNLNLSQSIKWPHNELQRKPLLQLIAAGGNVRAVSKSSLWVKIWSTWCSAKKIRLH